VGARGAAFLAPRLRGCQRRRRGFRGWSLAQASLDPRLKAFQPSGLERWGRTGARSPSALSIDVFCKLLEFQNAKILSFAALRALSFQMPVGGDRRTVADEGVRRHFIPAPKNHGTRFWGVLGMIR